MLFLSPTTLKKLKKLHTRLPFVVNYGLAPEDVEAKLRRYYNEPGS